MLDSIGLVWMRRSHQAMLIHDHAHPLFGRQHIVANSLNAVMDEPPLIVRKTTQSHKGAENAQRTRSNPQEGR
jgi:hypothetical protein